MHGVPTISKDFEIFPANPHNPAEGLMPTWQRWHSNPADGICCSGSKSHFNSTAPGLLIFYLALQTHY